MADPVPTSLPELPDLREDQIPADVAAPEQIKRWRLCVGITRQVAGRDDWNFARQLYDGPLETGEDTDPPPAAAEA